MAKEMEDLTGNKYNMLKVIGLAEKRRKYNLWKCQCDCGNITNVRGSRLKSGVTKSCGCLRKRGRVTHNLSKTKLYGIRHNMIGRCYTKTYKNYKYYGEKGVTVCDEWLNPENGAENFYKWAIENGYKEGLTIDRKDFSKGYSPDNCRWITNEEQQRNKSNTIIVEYMGEKHCLSEWARILGTTRAILERRVVIVKKDNDIDRRFSFDKSRFKSV